MTHYVRRAVIAVVIMTAVAIVAIPLFGQSNPRWPQRNRETVDIGRLRRTYDMELGIVCYQSLFGSNETPFCLHVR